MNCRSKNRECQVFGVIYLVFLVIFNFRCISKQDSCKASSMVLSIDSIKISKQEFEWKMQNWRTQCFTYFLQNYHATYSGPKYWSQTFGNVTPLEWVKEKALQQIKDEKIKLTIMQQYGVLKGFNYLQFLESLQKENDKRKALIDNGKVVYGVQNFDANTFYEYIINNGMLETRRRIIVKEPHNDEVLKAYYDATKRQNYQLPNTVIATSIKIPKGEIGIRIYGELEDAIKNGACNPLHSVLNKYSSILDVKDIEVGPDRKKISPSVTEAVFNQATILNKVGMVGPIFQDEKGSDCFLICNKVMHNGYRPFLEVRENIKMRIAEDRFNELLKIGMRRAVIVVDNAVWSSKFKM